MIVRRAEWNEIEVGKLLDAGPGERAIFAPAHITSARLAELMVALANAHGGVILLGAAGRAGGIADEEALHEVAQAAQRLASPPLILPLPRAIAHEDRTFYLVDVPPGLPHAYSLDGRYLTYAGGKPRLLTPAELSALLLQRSEAGFEARPAPRARADDLDAVQVEHYGAAVQAPPDEPWERLLLGRGCLIEDGEQMRPTYAGILLFGRQPQRFLPNAEIILVRYAGPAMSDQFVRHDAGGTLADQIRQAEAFVMANMRRGMRLQAGDFVREETTEYPPAVVREAIVNAVAHRDYAIRGEGIRVLMFSDHLEIYSPGRLPGHITLENLRDERFSRNEALVQVLSDLGFVEQLGYGIDRMLVALAEAGLPAPRFEETTAGFRVTLYGRGDELVSPAPAPRWGNHRVSPRQERALAYVAEHGSITNREFHELAAEVSDETIRRDLADLVDAGLIMKVGDRKATYYILK